MTEDDIREYFNKYGKVLEIEFPFDKTKNQRRGFCFVTFEKEQVSRMSRFVMNELQNCNVMNRGDRLTGSKN